jgi:hypothetical protein
MKVRTIGHLGWLGFLGFLGFVPGWSFLFYLFGLCLFFTVFAIADRPDSNKSTQS